MPDRRLPRWTFDSYGSEKARDRCEPWMREHIDPIIEDVPGVERCERAIHLFGSSRVYVKFDDAGQPIGYYHVSESILRAGEKEPTIFRMKLFERELRRLIVAH